MFEAEARDELSAEALWARRREVAHALSTHPCFATLEGPQVTRARMVLRHYNAASHDRASPWGGSGT
ncbi:hypothetical protein GCM10009753_68220 [Streptantibioticus ferralitis]